jgi:hypothetical protein
MWGWSGKPALSPGLVELVRARIGQLRDIVEVPAFGEPPGAGRPLPFTARWSGSGPARCALIECVVESRSFWPVPGGGFDRAAPSGRRHDAMGTASPTARTRPQLSFLRTPANRSEYPTTQVTARDRAHPGKRSTRRRCRQADSIHVEYTTADPHDSQL